LDSALLDKLLRVFTYRSTPLSGFFSNNFAASYLKIKDANIACCAYLSHINR